ncbi:MAG: TrkH family potassium uptake protein [Roseburia sp.]|nr:TrkH family potassium uptake protein [Roseburia sp.]
MFTKIKNRMSGPQMIALGFFLIILAGTLLLMLPIASRSGEPTPFIKAAFTATSATCVTGLVVVDTFTHWSLFGQIVLLSLIQIGGLGFISLGVTVSLLLRKKIGLKQRGLIQESFNVLEIRGAVRLTKQVVFGTLFFEGCGALILSACFIPRMGILQGIYYGIFHSVSAFCNGGFDLMGRYGPGSSLTGFNSHPVVLITIMLLILIGGLGFIVWSDFMKNKLNFRRYSLHTKIVLWATVILTLGGAVLFYIIERNRIFADMTEADKILNAFFCSVTPRTAGFNSVDTGAMTDGGKLLTIVLMFIGGGSGSTAGGIKMTTMAVLLVYLKSTLTRTQGAEIFGRRLEDSAIHKAASVFFINISLGITAGIAICCIQNINGIDALFETFSAISTVGMTAGITGSLNTVSLIIVALLMYLGRVGSLSFAMSFTDKKKIAHIMQPVEKINIG